MLLTRLTRILMLLVLAAGTFAPFAGAPGAREGTRCRMACCKIACCRLTSHGMAPACCRGSHDGTCQCGCHCSMHPCSGAKTKTMAVVALTRIAPLVTGPALPAPIVVERAPGDGVIARADRAPDFEDPPPRA
jgi:hypothetical protein